MSRLLGRVCSGLVTIFIVVTLAFMLLETLPGDPLGLMSDPSLSLADRQRLEAVYGLDQPPLERYKSFLSHALRGDLGVSLRYHKPVSRVLARALGPTLLLGASAIVIAFTLGLALGTAAGLRRGGTAAFFVDRVLPALDALPPFWLGLIAIWLFAYKFGLLPASHMHDANLASSGLWDLLEHLLLPALVIGLPGAAPVARHHAAALSRTWRSEAIRSARALGVPEKRLVLRAARAALHPILVLFGLALPTTVGGVVVVEVVFSWPGIGRLQQQALLSRDLPLVLGGLLLAASAIVTGTLIADLLSALVDPRWRRTTGNFR